MKYPKKTTWACFVLLGACSALFAQETYDDIYELSPFIVESTDDVGYVATSTLAGTRLKTELRDVGAAVSIVTTEMFEDLGATDAQSILAYSLNTETAGVMGNYAGGGDIITTNSVDLNDNRVNPQNAQRVRGLAQAQLTRDFFETEIGFDKYNTDRVTINRGPNSLLFGIGSPGGVIDNSLKRAETQKEFGSVSVRIGERSSYRAEIDYNLPIIENRLAIRVAGLDSDTQYQQRPAYEKDKRLYVALSSVLFQNKDSSFFGPTRLRANFETGTTESNPPNPVPSGDGISSWFEAPDLNAIASTGGTPPAWLANGEFVPKYTVDARGLNSEGVPFGISASDIHGATNLPYYVNLSLFYEDIDAQNPSVSGTDYAGGVGRTLFGFGGRERSTWDNHWNTSWYSQSYFTGFRTCSLPTSVFDNRNILFSGNTGLVDKDFQAINVNLEQSFFDDKAGIEVAYNKQVYNVWARLPYTTGGLGIGGNDINIDVMEYLSPGIPNPNVGRMVVVSRQEGILSTTGYRVGDTEREASRLTAYYNLDFTDKSRFSWLGRHVFTGLIGKSRRDFVRENVHTAWDSSEIDLQSSSFHFAGSDNNGTGIANGRMGAFSQIYIGPSLLDPSIQSLDDIKITEGINIRLPEAGDTYYMWAYNRQTDEHVYGNFTLVNYLEGANLTRREIDTQVLSWQSYFFGGNVVGLVGWRKDKQTITEDLPDAYLPSGEYDRAALVLQDESLEPESGETLTFSVVGHWPDKFFDLSRYHLSLSAHYNKSENFNPVGMRSSIRGEMLESPAGETEEYGFTLGLMDNRISMRFNWYETSLKNDSASITGMAANPQHIIGEFLRRLTGTEEAGLTMEEALAVTGPEAEGVFSSYQDAYDKIVALLPADVQAVYNYRVEGTDANDDRENISNPTPTRDFVSNGFELDLVGNITDSWRVFMNVGSQETVENNIAKEQFELATQIRENILNSGFANVYDTPQLGEQATYLSRFDGSVYRPLLDARQREGTQSLEQRKWRVNAGTNYRFKEGFLEGVGIGTAIRWQSKAATGYPLKMNEFGLALPDLDNPFYGDEDFNGDVWIKYGRMIFNKKVDWSIQLNVRNVFGNGDNIPVYTNPDGQVAIFRNPVPTEFFLTNTFKF